MCQKVIESLFWIVAIAAIVTGTAYISAFAETMIPLLILIGLFTGWTWIKMGEDDD